MDEKRKKGPIVCELESEEAQRIEDTHGFNKALEARDAKRKATSSDDDDGDSSNAASKKSPSKKKAARRSKGS